MGVISRSIQQGLANGKGMIPLQSHHYPDAEEGDTVSGQIKMQDGIRHLDTAAGNATSAADNLIQSIRDNNGLTLGGGSESSD